MKELCQECVVCKAYPRLLREGYDDNDDGVHGPGQPKPDHGPASFGQGLDIKIRAYLIIETGLD